MCEPVMEGDIIKVLFLAAKQLMQRCRQMFIENVKKL